MAFDINGHFHGFNKMLIRTDEKFTIKRTMFIIWSYLKLLKGILMEENVNFERRKLDILEHG